MTSRGVLYSAYGDNAYWECKESLLSLKRSNPALGACVLTDAPAQFRTFAKYVTRADSEPYGRWAKLSADMLSPFEQTLYIDADTRINGDLSPMFAALESGWDFVATISTNQKERWLQHLTDEEKNSTLESVGFHALIIQAGVFGFNKTKNVARFFEEWRSQWKESKGEYEQGAFVRSLQNAPMKICLLSRHFNGGAVIAHRFGQARRSDTHSP